MTEQNRQSANNNIRKKQEEEEGLKAEQVAAEGDTVGTETQNSSNGNSETSGNENLDKAIEEIETLKKEIDYFKGRYHRALADYDNLTKRAAREVLEARSRGVEDFAKKMLPVVDTFDKAMEQLAESNVDKKFVEGMEMIYFQFTDILEKEGLKEIPAKGVKFNTDYHEAMCKTSVEELDDEIVTKVFEKGYMFNKRVLRTAKVEINNK